jgi:2-isopropylmalate synthase
MSFEHNLEYAELALDLGVDVLEAGFPSASKLDFEIVSAIAALYAGKSRAPTVAALCQLRSEQIDITIEALKPAIPQGRARLHTYLPVDPNLMQASLGEKAGRPQDLIKDVYDFVLRAVKAGLEVEFSPEGYSRMAHNFSFTTEAIRAAVCAGAKVINCPDTIGGAYRRQGREYFVEKMKEHAEIMQREFSEREIIWSTHCHNDFGLAVENSLNAVFYGPARQIEGCINGIGERAGNASLEQCVMLIKHFGAVAGAAPFCCGVKSEKLQKVSDFVKSHMLQRQPHAPIVGDNAARHSSGGHTNAVLHNPLAYQPFDPAEVGKSISFAFGPLSGGNHARAVIHDFGFSCSEQEKAKIAQYIKDFYKERRKGITDAELLEAYFEYRKPMRLERFEYSKSKGCAAVRFSGTFFGRQGDFEESVRGENSALAAMKQAIDRVFPGCEILDHQSRAETSGLEARSLSTIMLKAPDSQQVSGSGSDFDIEISALKALVDAANRAWVRLHYKKPVENGSYGESRC